MLIIYIVCFYKCSSLIELPDISDWDLSKVTSMKELFFGCKSIKILLYISNWNLGKVTDISSLFYGCSSLK